MVMPSSGLAASKVSVEGVTRPDCYGFCLFSMPSTQKQSPLHDINITPPMSVASAKGLWNWQAFLVVQKSQLKVSIALALLTTQRPGLQPLLPLVSGPLALSFLPRCS